MKKFLIIFILLCSNVLYSEDMTISFINRKFDPLKNPPEPSNKLRTFEIEGENYFIVQFTGPIYANWKNKISEEGGIFHSYIPHFAYIIQMTPEEKSKIEKFTFVRWIGLFHPEYKIHPNVYKKRGNEVEKALPTVTAVIEGNEVKKIREQKCNCTKDILWIPNDPLLHLSVRFFKGASLDNIADKLKEWGSDIQQIQRSCNRMIIRIPPDSLNALANLGEVQSIVPYSKKVLSSSTWRYSVQVPMDSFTIQQDDDLPQGIPWDTVTNGITLADKGITGKGEIITIFDSGLDYWSAFFQDPEDDPPGPSHIVIEAYTEEGGDLEEVSSPNEPYGCTHGTNIATIIAGNLSIADNHPNGVNLMHYYDWGGQTRGNIVDYFPVRLYIQDFGSTEGDSCKLGGFDFPVAMDKAYNTYDSKIHQNSWNYNSPEGEYIGAAIEVDNMVWNNKDFVVVFSAGNRGPDSNTIMPPSTAKNCISVGSSWVPSFDKSPDSVTSFSSRGWAADGRIKPEVVAPGGTDPFTENRHYVWGAKADTIWAGDSAHANLQGMGGTSQAAPHISAACAMIRQYFKDGFHPTGDTLTGISFEPSAALIKATLIASTEDMGTNGGNGNPVPNRVEGWGKVVLDNALYFAGESRTLVVSDNEIGVSTGDSVINTVTITNNAEPLKFVLAWSDTAAMALADPALVNDLDLIVRVPDGNRYRGNVFSGGFSRIGGSPDRVNNVEVAWLPAPAQTGIYRISVRGHNVPNGRVPFAIAITGGTSGTIEPPQNGEPEPQYLNINSPFIEETEIQLTLLNTANVNLTIYDVLGRKIETLINATIEPETEPLSWGEDVKPGLYFAVLKINGEKVEQKKILKIAR